ncbi:gas vesicle protein GvpG [Streptomyces odonnellii]|uniref:gas vesicle protein GvpG n=1 Tax=Streptomyces odonnellii TaxID=1417980 RepID=UPI00099C2033
MGLLTQILTVPLAPVRGVGWVVRRVTEVAEQEAYDTAPIERRLAELERELLEGRISEREFDRREDELLDRLESIQGAYVADVPATPPGEERAGEAEEGAAAPPRAERTKRRSDAS